MRKILLTINVDINDQYFDSFEGFEKMNIREVILSKKMILTAEELKTTRGQIVANTILEKSTDLLIGFAIQQKEDLVKMLEILSADGSAISKIYYDNGKRNAKSIKDYKEKYAMHSNWLHNSPEFVEHSYLEHENNVKEILQLAVQLKIDVIAI